MAITPLTLRKTIYGKKGFNKQVDTEFRELTSRAERFNVDKFFKLYDKLFFTIPKEGDKSHTNLYERSISYIRNYIDPKDTEIEILMQEVARLEDALSERIEENPFFPNGKLLTNPNFDHENNDQAGVPQAYVMEAGQKRAIYYWGEHRVLRESLGYTAQENAGEHVGSGWKGYIPTTQAMLDNIPSGPDIRNADDLFNLDYLQPTVFDDFRNLRETVESTTLTAGQIYYLKKRLDEMTPDIAGEDDVARILNMNQDGIRAYIVENYYDNYTTGTITAIGSGTDVAGGNVSLANPRTDEIDLDTLLDRIMDRVIDIIKGGDENDYVKFLRNKALENGTTLLKQTVADVIYVGQNDGTYPPNEGAGFFPDINSPSDIGPNLSPLGRNTMNNSGQGSFGGPRGGGGRGGY